MRRAVAVSPSDGAVWGTEVAYPGGQQRTKTYPEQRAERTEDQRLAEHERRHLAPRRTGCPGRST